jgi:hypothetical protein
MSQEGQEPLIAFIDELRDKESDFFADVGEAEFLERYISIEVDEIEFEFIGQMLRLTCRVVINFEEPSEEWNEDIAGGSGGLNWNGYL